MSNICRNVSFCFTDILEAAKKGHSGFSRSEKNGKVYFKATIWDKDEPNQYGQDVYATLNSAKDVQEDTVFVGNGKKQEIKKETYNTPTAPIVPEGEGDDLPF